MDGPLELRTHNPRIGFVVRSLPAPPLLGRLQLGLRGSVLTQGDGRKDKAANGERLALILL